MSVARYDTFIGYRVAERCSAAICQQHPAAAITRPHAPRPRSFGNARLCAKQMKLKIFMMPTQPEEASN